jgi:hypothetical protein
MIRIDLDDLPPRIAKLLADLETGEDLILVQGGAVLARLRRATEAEAAPDPTDEPEVSQEEVLEQFNAMIHDEF